MDTRDLYKMFRDMEENHESEDIRLHDRVDIELNENFVIETGVIGFTEDGGIILHLDEDAAEYLGFHGILNESEEAVECMKMGADSDASSSGSHLMGESSENSHPAEGAIRWRIIRQHPEIVGKYGPVRIMAAIEDVANSLGDLEEIGSSDVSIWVNQVIKDLESGHYDHLEKDEDDELNEIKKLAHGDHNTELEEGWKTWALGGAALIAALTGLNKYETAQLMKSDPQLAKLAHYREVAQQKGDTEKVKELDERIKRTLDHLQVTGYEIRDETGKPVDPVYEAEYQGRKVTLNKPMAGDVKKSKVYVKKPNGKVVKVNFGDKNMRIKKNSPGHRKSFRARHHCDNPGPKWKARYWSCRAW